MKKADKPTKKAAAAEPEEGATLSVKRKKNQRINFDETAVENAGGFSQQSEIASSYREVLSLPSRNISHRERMIWIQKHRVSGLWVQCEDCKKWRYMPHIEEKHELPKKWYCKMNPDTSLAKCSAPEKTLSLREQEELIYNEYSAGSLVWARIPGWPWWPAMVDDCPDTEQFYWLDGFSEIPEEYHVVFFDVKDVTRAWIPIQNLKPFARNDKVCRESMMTYDKERAEKALKQATDAVRMPLKKRLMEYSFIARYKGNINTPIKPSRHQLQKFKSHVERKFNIEFPLESSSDSEDDKQLSPANSNKTPRKNISKNNTPKKSKETVKDNWNDKSKKKNVWKSPKALSLTESSNDFTNNDSSKSNLTQTELRSEARKGSIDFDF